MEPSGSSSPVMHLRISDGDGIPIYLQIVNQVRFLVASGRICAGDELPPIRVLAEKLLINPNTVARAYRELETARVVEKRRTAGTYVADGDVSLTETERRRILSERIDGLLVEARQLAVSTDVVISLLRERDDLLKERPSLTHQGDLR